MKENEVVDEEIVSLSGVNIDVDKSAWVQFSDDSRVQVFHQEGEEGSRSAVAHVSATRQDLITKTKEDLEEVKENKEETK